MAYEYERLSTLDSAFLEIESESAYMHIAGTSLYEIGRLRTSDGGVDLDRIRDFTQRMLPRLPRYRQKLHWIPMERHPVWIDDPNFNLDYHLRHVSLPKPGDAGQLKQLVGRILSQALDREKPLWETWVVEGIAENRFALVSKVHHCMIDGIGGVQLSHVMLSEDPDVARVPHLYSYQPRPSPTTSQLLFDEIKRRAQLPFEFLRQGFGARDDLEVSRRSPPREGPTQPEPGQGGSTAMWKTLAKAWWQSSDSPFAGTLGPYRRFDWTSMSLREAKQIGKAAGGAVNDVMLATVTCAVRRFYQLRGIAPEGPFVVMAPVNMRSDADAEAYGNRLSAWLVDLPIGVSDPTECLRRIVSRTRELKRGHAASSGQRLLDLWEWIPGAVFSMGVRALSELLPFSMVVTNVPGVQRPVYLLGCELLETYGTVPIAGSLGLGIAITSYDERLFWGFHADWDLVPDLEDFVQLVDEAFDTLRSCMG